MTDKITKVIAWLSLVVALFAVAIAVSNSPKALSNVGAAGGMLIENYLPYVMYNDGIKSAKDITTTADISGAAGTFTGTLTGVAAAFSSTLSAAATTLSGILRTDAGTTNSYSLATTTAATTYTLTAADIGNYDTIRQILTGGAATFTLPASSTITALVPTAGDRAETCWLPLTNTLTFAAGTGIDMMVATSTNNGGGAYDLTITAGGVGCIQWFRQADTDITAGLIEYENGD